MECPDRPSAISLRGFRASGYAEQLAGTEGDFALISLQSRRGMGTLTPGSGTSLGILWEPGLTRGFRALLGSTGSVTRRDLDGNGVSSGPWGEVCIMSDVHEHRVLPPRNLSAVPVEEPPEHSPERSIERSRERSPERSSLLDPDFRESADERR